MLARRQVNNSIAAFRCKAGRHMITGNCAHVYQAHRLRQSPLRIRPVSGGRRTAARRTSLSSWAKRSGAEGSSADARFTKATPHNSARADPEKIWVLIKALFRRCTLCTSRKSDEIRAQVFQEMPQANYAVLPKRSFASLRMTGGGKTHADTIVKKRKNSVFDEFSFVENGH